MDDGKIIDLEEIRRVRKQATVTAEDAEDTTASVRLAVREKNRIEFSISDEKYMLTEAVAHNWISNLRIAIRNSKAMGEPVCVTCERHGCRRVHPGQSWKRKSDGKMVTIEAVFGARIQVLHESGRITTITGQYKLAKRYLGPWE